MEKSGNAPVDNFINICYSVMRREQKRLRGGMPEWKINS